MYRTLLLPLALVFHIVLRAQCGACAIGDTCTVDPPFPTVCPAITPDGTVGVPYEVDVTFWIPPSFPEPTTNLNVVVSQIVLNSLENVPLGLTYQASSPDLTYYPQINPFGCVRVCGTPMVAGSDTIFIHATATATVGGLGTTQDYDLPIPILIHPAALDTAPDFSISATTGCPPLTVSFDPLINAPGLTSSYNWNFGNGNAYVGATPPDQTYTGVGDHIASLQTTVSVPVLTQLTVSSINNAWCGDVDEPNIPIIGCVGQPDLFFTITDAQFGLSTSITVNNVQSHTWNNLSIPLTFPPFTLRVYDQDAVSADDLLGTFQFTNSGNFSFSQGGTAGQGVVQIQTVQVFNYSDTITVLPAPNTTITFNGSVLCAYDQGLVAYEWTLNGTVLLDEQGPCVLASNGQWSVTGTNSFGCTSTSNYQVIGMGLSEYGAGSGLDLFPVPNSGRFTVRLRDRTSNARILLRVFDAVGALVYEERVNGAIPEGGSVVDLSGVAAGSYTLRVDDGTRELTRSFVVRPH
ncbi:MAG: hypothetical protein IPI81_11580 [Flavobacteriales bacterium]|nr:hypothetical protein [Flavobacteriales bacterium]MCC6937943.1 hypothetical protein [Flavobacteriales bacterium]